VGGALRTVGFHGLGLPFMWYPTTRCMSHFFVPSFTMRRCLHTKSIGTRLYRPLPAQTT
jgi:hypothetical protein